MNLSAALLWKIIVYMPFLKSKMYLASALGFICSLVDVEFFKFSQPVKKIPFYVDIVSVLKLDSRMF